MVKKRRAADSREEQGRSRKRRDAIVMCERIKSHAKMSHQTSKSFRATLPNASDDQLQLLKTWADANCSKSVLLRDESGVVVWLASRERARSKSAFLKSTRALLKDFGFDVEALKRPWLAFSTEDVVDAEVASSRKFAQSAPCASEPSAPLACGTVETTDDDDVKVIVLSGVAGTSGRGVGTR